MTPMLPKHVVAAVRCLILDAQYETSCYHRCSYMDCIKRIGILRVSECHLFESGNVTTVYAAQETALGATSLLFSL